MSDHECDLGRKAVALATALANDEFDIYRSLLAELDAQEQAHIIDHLVGMVVGALNVHGKASEVIAVMGPRLELRRG